MWPWSQSHTWRAWRDHYVNNKERMDYFISLAKRQLGKGKATASARQRNKSIPMIKKPLHSRGSGLTRVEFTQEDDQHIVEYLAIENYNEKDRMGQKLWNKLYANVSLS